MRGERVAQKMGPDFFLQTPELRDVPHNLPNPRGGESSAMPAEEDFAARLWLDQKRPSARQPTIERRHCFLADGNDALAIPLPDHAQEFFLAQIILVAQADDFPGAQAAGV